MPSLGKLLSCDLHRLGSLFLSSQWSERGGRVSVDVCALCLFMSEVGLGLPQQRSTGWVP